MVPSKYDNNVHADKNKLIFRKIEGYTCSGLGTRSTGWLTCRLADENLKFGTRPRLQYFNFECIAPNRVVIIFLYSGFKRTVFQGT